jgi:hypothetical protein
MVPTRSRQSANAVTASFTTPPHPTRRSRNQETPGSAASVVSAASNSTTTSARSRNPLPNHLLSQLAEHIEAYGGIEKHSGSGRKQVCKRLLDHLISIDPLSRSLYKEANDPIRKRITQKVYTWQRLHQQGTYKEKVLRLYNITPASQRDSLLQIPIGTLEVPVRESTPAPTQPPVEEIYDRIPSSVSFFSGAADQSLLEEEEEQEQQQQQQQQKQEERFPNRMTNEINLHLKEPWKNPSDVFVLTGERSKKNDEEIATRVDIYFDIDDIRDYQNGSYTLEWAADGAKLIFSKPAIPMFKIKKETTLHQLEKDDEKEAKIIEQHKVVCTTMNKNPMKNKREQTYVFPSGIRVSNEAFNSSASGKKFEGKLGRSAVKSKDKNDKDVQQLFHHVRYSMVVKGTTELTHTVNKKKEEEELSKLMAGTQITYESD